MSKPVRIKDIAIKAGVSAGTVDRVLHQRGEVKKETREKIMAIAKELNYKPNVAARILKAPVVYRIAVLLPVPVNEKSFWTKHPVGIANAVESISPYNVEPVFYQFHIQDGDDFNKQTRAIIKNRPDGIIMAPLHRQESIAFCKQLDEIKIPYIFIDTNIDATNCLSYIGEDAVKSGRIAASLIDVMMPVVKDVLIVNIAKSLVNAQHLNSRNQGFLTYFNEAGRNQGLKISVDIPADDEKTVSGKLDHIFSTNKNIGGILVSGARTYVIARYLKASNLNKVLIGYESIGENVEYLNEGVIDFLVSQRPVEQAEKAMHLLIDAIVNKADHPKEVIQPIDIVNKESLV